MACCQSGRVKPRRLLFSDVHDEEKPGNKKAHLRGLFEMLLDLGSGLKT